MRRTSRYCEVATLAIAMGVMIAGAPALHAAQDQTGAAAMALKAKLHGSQYKDVQASVDQNGIATLSGSVELYQYKEDANRTAQKVKGVVAVRDDIQVMGNIPDSEITKKLAPQLAYSRVGYGNLFDAIVLQVQDGVVTLSGHAHDYPSRDAAVALAATTAGVKDVIDDIQVDPASQMDWRIRMAVAQAIYSYPALQKYAINPIRPIRISVQNGHVELYGAVDSTQDRQLAFMRADAVPGVFSVKNYIEVQGQGAGKQESEAPQR